MAEQPLDHPLYGSFVDLKGTRVDLAGVQAIAVYGRSQKLEVKPGVNTLSFVPDDDSGSLTLEPADVVTILDPANLPLDSDGLIPDWSGSSDVRQLRVLDASGRPGTLAAALGDFTLVPASSKEPGVQEFALVSSVSLTTDPYPHTRIHLKSELLNCYDRTATAVNANVGLATQGMSVSEILGSGSAATPNQTVLAQAGTAYFRPVADAHRTAQHAGSHRGRGRVEGRSQPVSAAAIGARVRHAESSRGPHGHFLRRRRRRVHGPDRAEQRPRELSHRFRAGGQRRRRLHHHVDGSPTRRERRQQSAGGDGRPGCAVGRRNPRERAAVGAYARARGVGHRLPELRAVLRRHREGLCHLDPQRSRPRCVRHRRGGRRIRVAARQCDPRQPGGGVAELRQSARPDPRAVVPRNAVLHSARTSSTTRRTTRPR